MIDGMRSIRWRAGDSVGIERKGLREGWLTIAASMGNEEDGWAGVYVTPHRQELTKMGKSVRPFLCFSRVARDSPTPDDQPSPTRQRRRCKAQRWPPRTMYRASRRSGLAWTMPSNWPDLTWCGKAGKPWR